MQTNDSLTHATPRSDREHPARRLGAVAVLAVLALGACTSDPSAHRVVEDIIRAETEDDASSDRRDCMLEALEDFSDDDLENITTQLDSSNEGNRVEGQAALDDFESALSACN